MRFTPVLAAAVAIFVVGPAEPPRSQTPKAPAATQSPPDMMESALGKSSRLPPAPQPQAHGVPTPLGTLARHNTAVPPAQSPAAAPAPEAAPLQQEPEAPPQPSEAQQSAPAAPSEALSSELPWGLLSPPPEIPQGPAVSVQLDGPAQGQADQATPSPPAAGTPQQLNAMPGEPTPPPSEKPPRVAEYHWFEAEARDGVAAIGYGHPKRQRGGEFLIGFTCKAGSGKITFVMFEAGTSRSQFKKGQKVAVALEIGSTAARLEGLIESNEGTSFPRANATISADDALFKVMDDDAKVLRIDIDGWSAAVPLFLIKDVMPAFSKACAKEKTRPEASAQAPDAVPADPARPAQGQAELATPSPPAAAEPQQPEAVPGKPTPPSGEKPPRVAEYHWFEAEPRDGVTAIGYGHPKRQRGGEFLMGFTCKAGSGKITFVMFEAGTSRSQFTKGQKVAVTLEIGSTNVRLGGAIESNEGTSFPRASATIPAGDALFKAMDDEVKVLRVDIDGWSAAAPLFLLKDVMPAFSKTCAKKTTKPETSVQARDTVPAKRASVNNPKDSAAGVLPQVPRSPTQSP